MNVKPVFLAYHIAKNFAHRAIFGEITSEHVSWNAFLYQITASHMHFAQRRSSSAWNRNAHRFTFGVLWLHSTSADQATDYFRVSFSSQVLFTNAVDITSWPGYFSAPSAAIHKLFILTFNSFFKNFVRYLPLFSCEGIGSETGNSLDVSAGGKGGGVTYTNTLRTKVGPHNAATFALVFSMKRNASLLLRLGGGALAICPIKS